MPISHAALRAKPEPEDHLMPIKWDPFHTSTTEYNTECDDVRVLDIGVSSISPVQAEFFTTMCVGSKYASCSCNIS